MVDGVAEHIDVGEQLRGGVEVQLETDQALTAGFLRLHPQFHDAFTHRIGVAVAGEVADLEQHLGGQPLLERIGDEGVVDGFVDLGAFADHRTQDVAGPAGEKHLLRIPANSSRADSRPARRSGAARPVDSARRVSMVRCSSIRAVAKRIERGNS